MSGSSRNLQGIIVPRIIRHNTVSRGVIEVPDTIMFNLILGSIQAHVLASSCVLHSSVVSLETTGYGLQNKGTLTQILLVCCLGDHDKQRALPHVSEVCFVLEQSQIKFQK